MSNQIDDIGLEALYKCVTHYNEVLLCVLITDNVGSDLRAQNYVAKRKEERDIKEDMEQNKIDKKQFELLKSNLPYKQGKKEKKVYVEDDIFPLPKQIEIKSTIAIESPVITIEEQVLIKSESVEPVISIPSETSVVVSVDEITSSGPQKHRNSRHDDYRTVVTQTRQKSAPDLLENSFKLPPSKKGGTGKFFKINKHLTRERKIVHYFTPDDEKMVPPIIIPADGKSQLGKTIGVPYLNNLDGNFPIRPSIHVNRDSGQHFTFLKVTESEGVIPPISLVQIAKNREKEIQRVKADRQTIDYKEAKADVTRVDKSFKRNTPHKSALPPTSKKFWDIWKKTIRIRYSEGIDNAEGTTSTKLDPLLEELLDVDIRKKKKQNTTLTPGEVLAARRKMKRSEVLQIQDKQEDTIYHFN